MKENPVSVKTQFAGQDAHITLLKFLRYLEAKYFTHFYLVDEGGYWETNDEAVLKAQFEKYEFILDKYSQEDNKTRIKGNVVVSIYVVISFLSIFAVGLFKAGKS